MIQNRKYVKNFSSLFLNKILCEKYNSNISLFNLFNELIENLN
jgi:hypothetical protein